MAQALRDPIFGDAPIEEAPPAAPPSGALIDPIFGEATRGNPSIDFHPIPFDTPRAPNQGPLDNFNPTQAEFDADIAAAAARMKAPEPEKKPGAVMHALGTAGTAFNRGLADLAGMPVDLLTGALNLPIRGINALAGPQKGLSDLITGGEGKPLIPLIEKPFLGSEHLRSLGASTGIVPTDPGNIAEQMLAGTFHEIGANVLPMAGILRAAGRVPGILDLTGPARRGIPAETQAFVPSGQAPSALSEGLASLGGNVPGAPQSLLGSMAAPAVKAPGAFTGAQTTMAAGSGFGGAGAQTLVGQTDDPNIHALAGLAGGILGGVLPVGAMGAGRALMEAVPLTQSQKQLAAARKLGITPEMQLQLNAAQEQAPNVAGAKYTVPDLLNDQTLLATQRGLQRSSPEAVAAANTQRSTNAAAYRQFVADEAPGGDVAAPKRAASERVQEVQGRRREDVDRATAQSAADLVAAQEQAAAAEAAARDRGAQGIMFAEGENARATGSARAAAAEPLGTGVPAERKAAASEAARTEIEAARDAAKTRASALFRQVDPEGNITVPATPIERESREIVREAVARGRRDAIPDIIVSGEIEDYLGTQPIRKVEGLRQRLGEQIRQEQRSPQSSEQKISFLKDLKNAVDEVYTRLAGEEVPARAAVPSHVSDAEVERVLNEHRAQWYAERGVSQPAVSRVAGGDGRRGSTGQSGGFIREAGPGEGRPSVDSQGAGSARASAEGPGGQGRGASDPAEITAAGERYKVARDFFREHVASKFREGRIKEVLATGPDNRPKTKPSETLRNIVNPASGQPEAVQDFVRAVGGRPEAERALLDYAVADIAEFARDKAGNIVASKLQAWRDKHMPVLRAFPEVERVLSNVQRLQGRVDQVIAGSTERLSEAEALAKEGVAAAKAEGSAAVKQVTETGKAEVKSRVDRQKQTQREIDKSAAKFWLDESPDNAVASVLNAGDPAKAAKQTLAIVSRGGPEAAKGVAQATWDHVVQKMFSSVEGEGLKVATSARYLEQNRDALRVLLGGQDRLDKLETLLKASEINSRTGRAAVRGGSDTAQNLSTRGGVAKDIAKQSVSAVLGGGAGFVFGGPIGAALGAVAGKGIELAAKAQRDAVLKLAGEALADPEVFRTLTTAVTKANERQIANRLRGHLATLGLRSETELKQ